MPAMLAFCNDIDFCTWDIYKETHHVLYETLGRNITDSFWLFGPNGAEMSLFQNSIQKPSKYHDNILEEISNGNLEVLHSVGFYTRPWVTDVVATREETIGALSYLYNVARVPEIYTNHGGEGDIQNIGNDRSYYEADNPRAKGYILDVLNAFGFKYFWTDVNYSDNFVFTDYNGNNPLVSISMTKAGWPILCFNRYRGILPTSPNANLLPLQLSVENIARLEEAQGYCIIYQHFGANHDKAGHPFSAVSPVFSKESLDALDRLAKSNIEVVNIHELLNKFSTKNIKEINNEFSKFE